MPVAPSDPSYPLDQDDKDSLTKVLELCNQQDALIQKAAACGLQVDEHQQVNNAQRELAQKIREQFFGMRGL